MFGLIFCITIWTCSGSSKNPKKKIHEIQITTYQRINSKQNKHNFDDEAGYNKYKTEFEEQFMVDSLKHKSAEKKISIMSNKYSFRFFYKIKQDEFLTVQDSLYVHFLLSTNTSPIEIYNLALKANEITLKQNPASTILYLSFKNLPENVLFGHVDKYILDMGTELSNAEFNIIDNKIVNSYFGFSDGRKEKQKMYYQDGLLDSVIVELSDLDNDVLFLERYEIEYK